jgi:putative inorganic carbon (HCO3(-)) transporter
MVTKSRRLSWKQDAWYVAEWVLLLAAAPFLLLPTLRETITLVMLGLLCLLWLAQALRRQPWPQTPFNGVLLLFSVMLFVSVLITPTPDLTLPKATGAVLGLALFRLLARMSGRRGGTVCLGGLLLAGMGVWGLGLLDLNWPAKVPVLQAWLDHLPQHVARFPGAPGGGISPNQLAGALVLVLPAALAASLGGPRFENRWIIRLLGLGATVLWGATLFLTQSRGGWVGGAAGALVFLALWGLSARNRWQRWAGMGVPALVVLGGVVVFLFLGFDRISERLYGATEGAVETAVGAISFRGRVEIWSRALYTLYDFPFAGRGLGTFRQAAPYVYPLLLVSPDKDIAHAHNVFLQMGVDLGLPGLIAYVALLVVAVRVGWQRIRRGGWGRWAALGVLAGLLGFHVYGLADTLSLGSKPSFLFWWLLALLAVEPDP